MTAVRATTRVGAVIGWPIEHSRSPALHNAAFAAEGLDAVFVALPVVPGAAAAAIAGMAACGFLGACVTVPHKLAARDACDRLAPSARAVGAVNCIEFAADGVVGHNTDAGGYVDALREATGVDPRGCRALLLGGGGAARAVAAGLADAGAGEIRLVVRTPEKVDWSDDAQPWTDEVLAELLPACDLLVDCTSTGLDPATEARIPAPLPVAIMPPDAIVSTLVYHRETALLADARSHGLRVLDGAGMLVHQGARAFELWTGVPAPLEAMWSAMRA